MPSPPLDPARPTAIFLLGNSRGAGMHLVQWVLRLFGDRFHNHVFLSVGEVDKDSYSSERTIKSLQARIDNSLNHFTSYSISRGHAAVSYAAYGADPLEELTQLTLRVLQQFPNGVCFASKLVFGEEGPLMRLLHNQLPMALQRRLHLAGHQMIIVPIKLDETAPTVAGPAPV